MMIEMTVEIILLVSNRVLTSLVSEPSSWDFIYIVVLNYLSIFSRLNDGWSC